METRSEANFDRETGLSLCALACGLVTKLDFELVEFAEFDNKRSI